MMHAKQLLALAAASLVAAQQQPPPDSQGPDLTTALGSQNDTLSVLIGLLNDNQELAQSISGMQNVTILAPNNDALNALMNDTQAASMLSQPGYLDAVLTYHVLNGTYPASAVTAEPVFIPSMLTDDFNNVTGGQRVYAMREDDNVIFYGGLRQGATVETPDLNFTGGVIHIIDDVLTIPMNISATLSEANLTALAGAARQAELVAPLSAARDVTIFAPSNDAFSAVGSLVQNMTMEELADVLQYHVVPGRVAYSSMLMNTTLQTMAGGNLTITVVDDDVFVNSAQVAVPDTLVANGVVHVIDSVLNPQNATATPDPGSDDSPPAFPSASSGSDVPFTSGVPTPTGTSPAATGGSGSNSGDDANADSTDNAALPMQTGALGAAALFGGAAIFANL